MGESTCPLRLPTSVKTAAATLAKADGVSLNQFIAAAVAEKVGVMETAREFLERRAGEIKIGDTALDSPSDAERARRERMKREG